MRRDSTPQVAPTRRDSRENERAGSRLGSERSEWTRREYVRYGGAVVGGCLLAGCVGGSGPGPTPTESNSATETNTPKEESYTVTMEPVSEVEFDEVPETWVPYTGDYADMGVALGQSDGLAAIGVKARFGSHLYEDLPGVSVNKSGLTALYEDGTGKEVFYEHDADVPTSSIRTS